MRENAYMQIYANFDGCKLIIQQSVKFPTVIQKRDTLVLAWHNNKI